MLTAAEHDGITSIFNAPDCPHLFQMQHLNKKKAGHIKAPPSYHVLHARYFDRLLIAPRRSCANKYPKALSMRFIIDQIA